MIDLTLDDVIGVLCILGEGHGSEGKMKNVAFMELRHDHKYTCFEVA